MERATAIPVWISELFSGSFLEQEDAASTVVLPDGRQLQRVRLFGVVVSTEELVIDDGTGSILVRTFENQSNALVGDPVLVIGRPRIYNGQQYLLGEIVKKINSKWLELRNKQQLPEKTDVTQLALNTVRGLDKGDGADYNEVLAQLGEKGEDFIIHLLSKGELFETRPGKLKILE